MINLVVIGSILYLIGGIIGGISLFGNIYHKIPERTSKILSNIALLLVCISGISSWIFLIFK